MWARCYERAISLLRAEPQRDPAVRELLDKVEVRQKEWQRVVALFDGALEVGPDAPLFVHIMDVGRFYQRNEDAARVGAILFERAPDPDLAFQVARAWARAGDAACAASWLLRAAEAGFRYAELLDKTRDFDAMREIEAFQKAAAAIAG